MHHVENEKIRLNECFSMEMYKKLTESLAIWSH